MFLFLATVDKVERQKSKWRENFLETEIGGGMID